MVWDPSNDKWKEEFYKGYDKYGDVGTQYYGTPQEWSYKYRKGYGFNVGEPEWMFSQYARDPMVEALSQRVTEDFGKDYRGQYMQQANVGIDQQIASIGQALAGRGGGGFGSAIGMGAQARSGALLGALGQAEAARIGAQDRFGSFLTDRYNILNQIMGGHLGQVQGALAYKGQKAGAEAAETSAVYGMIGQILGGASIGGGD